MEYTDILINIRKILRSINLESKRIQKEHGISIPQYLCLHYLNNQHEYKATATDIRSQLNLNASTVSGIIARLEAKGYVAKLPNQGDRRSTYIFLTALGEKIVLSIPDLLHQKLSRKLGTLPKDDLKMVQDALSLLVQFMEVENIDAAPLLTPEEQIVQEN